MKNHGQNLFGKIRKNVSLAGFDFTETIYPERLSLPSHSHDFAYFCFVLGGNFTEKIEKKEYLCQASTVVFHQIGENHSDYFHKPSCCFNVRLNPHMSEHLLENDGKFNQTVIQNIVGLNHLIARLYK